MKNRRLKKAPAELELTAFINLIVVLVPFLLSTAVFSRLALLDLNLPAQQNAVEQISGPNLQLEVVVRADALEVGDRIGGLIQRIPKVTVQGQPQHDFATLTMLMLQVKAKFPDATDSSVLAEPTTSYDELVQVMDHVRSAVRPAPEGGLKTVRVALFPNISIGDAPVRRAAGAPAAKGAS
jgi:biopolymer transport protein ExbD